MSRFLAAGSKHNKVRTGYQQPARTFFVRGIEDESQANLLDGIWKNLDGLRIIWGGFRKNLNGFRIILGGFRKNLDGLRIILDGFGKNLGGLQIFLDAL